ncbi:hypothetical protein GF354_02835 [Candidatus Peregrinibacteria bacterium]|nr:hypothetical protein [Candidatus Peregrinibacteria bacterium]
MNMKKIAINIAATIFCVAIFVGSAPITFALSASGGWNGSDGLIKSGGSINFNFPAKGGNVDGTYSGSSKTGAIQFGGRFSGSFTGCWDGTMSGSYSGWTSQYVGEEQINSNASGT